MAAMLTKIACVVVACMVVSAPYANAITCGDVASALMPCLNYLRNGGVVPRPCCNGVTGLNNNARSTFDRRTICNCLKSTSRTVSGIKPGFARDLPGKCQLRIPYQISPNTDCSRVQ